MNSFVKSVLILVGASLVVSLPPSRLLGQLGPCRQGFDPNDPLCQDYAWRVQVEKGYGGGAVVYGEVSGLLSDGVIGRLYGDRTFGGINDGDHSVGGGFIYNHPSGLFGKLDATHVRGQGNQYSGMVGGSARVGPGTLTIGGGITGGTDGKPLANVSANFTVPLR